MKKISLALLFLLMLSGCMEESDLPQVIDASLHYQLDRDAPLSPNMNKRYYSYYLPRDMGRKESSEISEVLEKDGIAIIMNFDPSSVIIQKFYSTSAQMSDDADNAQAQEAGLPVKNAGLSTDEKTVYDGTYVNNKGEVKSYQFQLLKNQSDYLMYFDFKELKFYTLLPAAEVENMISSIMTIAKTLEYDADQIVNDFSMKKQGEAKKQTIEQLQQNLSKDGTLSDLIQGDQEPSSEIVPSEDGRH